MPPHIRSHPGLNYEPDLVDKKHAGDLLDALTIKADQERNPHAKDRGDQIIYVAALTDGRRVLMYSPSLEAFCLWNGTKVSFRMDLIDIDGERYTYEPENFGHKNNPDKIPTPIINEILKICNEFAEMNMGRVHARDKIRAALSAVYYKH